MSLVNSVNFQEEFTSKIPALTSLTILGYQFIPPSQCNAMRSRQLVANKTATARVVLLPIMRKFLAKQPFPFEGKQHHLSAAAKLCMS